MTAVTVSPALVLPIPVVRTERGESREENFRNCDLAVPEHSCEIAHTSTHTLHMTLVEIVTKKIT